MQSVHSGALQFRHGVIRGPSVSLQQTAHVFFSSAFSSFKRFLGCLGSVGAIESEALPQWAGKDGGGWAISEGCSRREPRKLKVEGACDCGCLVLALRCGKSRSKRQDILKVRKCFCHLKHSQGMFEEEQECLS